MVPSQFVAMAALPLTPSGSKVDRQKLPEPESNATRSQREYVAPRTELERTLAEIWAEVLGEWDR